MMSPLQAKIEALMEAIDRTRDPGKRKKMRIAIRVMEGMVRRGINQIEFARMMGVHKTMITQWLDGTTNFQVDTILKIEKKLGITIIDIP